MSHDPHRPVFHFTTDNWMNDPKPFYADGAYHVFFQHNPDAPWWGNMHWGHAVSRDLVHWETLPIALAPTPGGPDQDGCWTGCALRAEDGRFRILYTGIPGHDPFKQVQCLATGSDDLQTWTKHPGNPIQAEQPEGFGPCFRDPQAWKSPHDGRWYMIIGGEQADGSGGVAFLYRCVSDDFTRWESLPPLFVGDKQTGHDFECPDFFALPAADEGGGDAASQHLLLTSRNQTWWHVGALDTASMRFARNAWGMCDGGNFYAAKTLLDGQGRRVLFGWITEARSKEAQAGAGWSGVLSLPRLIRQGEDGTPRFTPAPELAALRRSALRQLHDLQAGREEVVIGDFPDTLEIAAEFAPGAAAQKYGLFLDFGDDRDERVLLEYDPAAGRLGNAPLTLAPSEGLSLQVFVDRSVIEVFANERACLTLRTYPARPGSVQVGLPAAEGVALRSAMVWEMGLL